MNSKNKKMLLKDLRTKLIAAWDPEYTELSEETWASKIRVGNYQKVGTALLQLEQKVNPGFELPYEEVDPKLVSISPENPLEGSYVAQEGLELELGERLPTIRIGEKPQGAQPHGEVQLPTEIRAPDQLVELLATPEKVLIFRSLLRSWLLGDPTHCCFLTSDELVADILVNWIKFMFGQLGWGLEIGNLQTLLEPLEELPRETGSLLISRRVIMEELTYGVRNNLGSIASANLEGPTKNCLLNCVPPSTLLLDLVSVELRHLLPQTALVIPIPQSSLGLTFTEAKQRLKFLKDNTAQLTDWVKGSPYRLDSPSVIGELTIHLARGERTSLRNLLVEWTGSLLRKKDNSRVGVKDALTAFLSYVADELPEGYSLGLSWNLSPSKFSPLLRDVLESDFAYPLSQTDGSYIKKNEGFALTNFVICKSAGPKDTATTTQLVPVTRPAVARLKACTTP